MVPWGAESVAAEGLLPRHRTSRTQQPVEPQLIRKLKIGLRSPAPQQTLFSEQAKHPPAFFPSSKNRGPPQTTKALPKRTTPQGALCVGLCESSWSLHGRHAMFSTFLALLHAGFILSGWKIKTKNRPWVETSSPRPVVICIIRKAPRRAFARRGYSLLIE